MSALSGRSQTGTQSCPTCGFTTTSSQLLASHIQHHKQPLHLINRNYRCKRCHFTTTRSKLFLYHQKRVHGDNISIYPCDLCDYASRYKCKVLRHRKFVHASALDIEPTDLVEDTMESAIEDTLVDTVKDTVDKSENENNDIKESEQTKQEQKEAENLDLNGNEMTDAPAAAAATQVTDPDSTPQDHIKETSDAQGTTFQCKLCPYSHSHKFKVVNHVKSVHMTAKVFKCPQCNFVTSRKLELVIHKTKHSSNTYSCDECEYQTISKEDYERHTESHKTESIIKCRLCDFSCRDGEMQVHMQQQHPLTDINEMAAAYQVKLEDDDRAESPPSSVTPPMLALAKLAAQDPLAAHPSPGLQPDTDVSCTVCGLVLKSDAKLRIHMVSHTQESTHRCPLCTLKYKRSSDLNRHMKKKHGIRLRDYMLGEQEEPLNLSLVTGAARPAYLDGDDDQPLDLSCKKSFTTGEGLKCHLCTYVAKWPSDLHRHMLVHSVEKRYKCTYCSRRYKYKFDLNMHLRKMHKVPAGRVKMTTDEEPVAIDDDEESHMEIDMDQEDEDGEDREYMSSPSSPGSSEGDSYSLYNSTSITPLKPAAAEKLLKSPRQLQLGPASKFRCEYCPYYGACRSEVDRHLRLHTGEKPYSCLFCSYKSHWKGDMKRHIQKHHPEELKTEEDIVGIMNKAYQPENAFDHVSGSGILEIKPLDASLKPSSPDSSSTSSGAPPNMIVTSNGEVLPSPGKSSNGSQEGSPKKNMCPYCPFVCEAPSKLKCHMEIHENLKRFKCPHCGKRSNWTWDVRKHIKKEHPGRDLNVIELPEEEARNSLGEYLQQQQVRYPTNDFMNSKMPPTMVARRTLDFIPDYADSGDSFRYDDDASGSAFSELEGEEYNAERKQVFDSQPRTGRYRPFKCSKCGRRSNWKWDLRKHMRTAHPDSSARMIIMSEEEARASWPPEKPINTDIDDIRRISLPKPEPAPAISQQQVLQQVDTKRLKRFKCAMCPYRSNYRSDIGRHTKRLHNKMPFKVIILDEDEAERSLEAYKDTFGHKKFVLSPAKNKVAARMRAAQMRQQVIDPDSFSYAPELPRYGSPGQGSTHSNADSELTIVEDVDMPESCSEDEVSHDQGAVKVKVWKCSRCEFKDRDKLTVMTHLRQHPRTKIFRCKLCGDTSDYRNSIYRHIRNRHQTADVTTSYTEETFYPKEDTRPVTETMTAWNCTLCDHVADCKSAIIAHVEEHHPDHELEAIIEPVETVEPEDNNMDDEVPEGVEVPDLVPRQNVGSGPSAGKHLRCNVCPYRTNKSGLLKIHKTYHKIQPGNRFKCKYCPYYVSAMRLLHQHVRLHLQQRGEVHVGEPGTKIDEGSVSPLHIDEDATKGSRHCCDQCPFVCRNKNDFIYHKQFHRQKPSAPFKCPQCPYWVSQKRLLRQHERVHTSDYSVKINGTLFSQSHMSPRSEMEDSCDPVDMASLKQQIIASKVTPVPVTPEKFTPIGNDDEDMVDDEENDERMTMHGFVVDEDGQLVKSGLLKKLYKCTHCPYTNVRSTNLKLHEAMHADKPDLEDLHRCPHCTYNTDNKGLLSLHLKVHSLQYEPGRDDINDYDDEDEEEKEDDQPLELTKKPEPRKPGADETKKSAPEARKAPAENKIDVSHLPTDYYLRYSDSGQHIMERATVQKFCCEKCPYSTLRSRNFERHALLHGCKQRFTCEYCDYSVPAYQLLLQHKQLHLRPNPNLLCMQSVSNLSKMPEIRADVAAAAGFPVSKDDPISPGGGHDHLDLYENSDDFVEPKKLYRCERCPFTNTRRDNLLAHLKFHMVRSALQCSYCDYSVSKQHLLTQHMKVHFTDASVLKSPTESPDKAPKCSDKAPECSDKAPKSPDKAPECSEPKVQPNPGPQDEKEPEYIDLSELPKMAEEENNNEDSGKENLEEDKEAPVREADDFTCQYCDRTFPTAEKHLKHESQHLIGKKY